MFYSCKKSLSRKNPVFAIENFTSFYFIQFTLYFLSSGRLREVKNKRKFQTFSFKSYCGRLQKVPNMVI